MADISVHIFVQNLKELMKSQHPKIAGEKDQLESLYKDFFLMSSFLKKLEEKFSFDNEKVNNLVTEIRELVLEVENIVDHFVADELSLDLKSLEKQIEKVKIDMDQMNAAFDQSIVVGEKIQKKTVSREISGDSLEAVVGINEIIEKILAGFDGDQEMEVISVVGLPGIGKTTLAEKVFEHSRTRSSFQVRAWVTVSQTYSSKQLLIDILHSSSLYENSDAGSSEDRLGEDLLKRLKDKKYLIVLDDIWSIEAWNGIQRSFPSNNNGSRVIYTSRFAAIGKDVCRDLNTHILTGLSEKHSWNLLKNKVFGDGDCLPELERFGREIAKKCDGLPLAIVVIGGILANKEKTTEEWEQVASRLAPAIATDRGAYMDTLALSYQHLPVHLKACFLYLGSIFPEDHEIPVRKLVWLLVAEGFSIQENNDDQQAQSSEVIVEGYLNELVQRSPVTVARKRSCSATKTIRIHDLLRDFCFVQGEQEKFILKLEGFFASYSSHTVEGQRRLLVDNLFLSSEISASNLRSLFLENYLSKSAEFFAHSYRLLKVLQVGSIPVEILNNIENKAHLRYLEVSSFWGESNTVFPSSVTKLVYLETFILGTYKATIMPDDIWNMVKLRHLYNEEGGIFHFKASPSQGGVLPQLQTLRTLCACKSCLTNLVRFPNLKKLGLKGSLTSESGHPTIPDLGFLEQLVTLKVTNTNLSFNQWRTPDRSSALFKLKLPASLRKLTLQRTYLKWEEISVLAELENLEVLKLLDDACVDTEALSGWDTSDLDDACVDTEALSGWDTSDLDGACVDTEALSVWDTSDLDGACVETKARSGWDTSDLEFPKLKYLKLKNVNINKWDDSDLQFESLEILAIKKCWPLESIPFDLALSPSLHTIEVTCCSTSLEMIAKEIAAEHETQCGNKDLQVFIN